MSVDLSPAEHARVLRFAQRLAVEQRLAPWCPHKPTEKQLDALLADDFELLYGGAMGGGKSDWILMDALQWVHVPGYQALILRRSMTEADRMGAIFDRAKKWFIGRPGVEFDARSNTFIFNVIARITFGYLDKLGDETRFNGTEMQRVYFDELQDFEWSQFEYLFQRVRANETITVPWAVRAGAMPGGVGQDWVRERFVLRSKPDANKPWIPDNDNNTPAFVPALSTDNPHLSRDYETKSLANLDAFTRASRGKGDWSITPDGNLFKREWFPIVERLPDLFTQSVRFWDFAATEKKPGKNPDATASVKMHICGNVIYVSDVTETFLSPGATQAMMRNMAIADGVECAVRWEEELGSSGAHATSLLQRHSLPEFNADGVRVSGDKVERAKPFSAASEKRLVYLVRGDWNQMFLTRMCGFPVGKRDVTDATSGAFAYLQENAIAAAVVHDEGDERRTQTSKVRTMVGLGLRARRMR